MTRRWVNDMTVYRVVYISSVLVLMVLMLGCNRTNSDPIAQTNSNSTSASQALIIRPADSPATGDSREPELTATADGRIILSWVEKVGEKRYALRMASRDQTTWNEPRTIGEGENWFVNWADFPSVISLNDGSLAAHWLVKSGTATYAYNVNIALSKDGGKTWCEPIVPHLDDTQTEHGFVSLVPLTDGRLGAIWLDGRNMKDMKDNHDEGKPSSVSMTLRYAAIDGSGKISNDAQLDERVCECCQTSATITSDGVLAVYRDRSAKRGPRHLLCSTSW